MNQYFPRVTNTATSTDRSYNQGAKLYNNWFWCKRTI